MAYDHLNQDMQHSVLIVDSDPAVRRLLAKELYLIGMRVYGFNSAGDARKLLNKILPDLIILEQNLIDQPGTELCAELRMDNRYLWVPIFFLTSVNDMNKKLECYQLGADYFITKPFDPKEMAALVRASINRIKSFQSNSVRDQLTGLFSRKYFNERLDEEIRHYKRRQKPFSVTMLDLDYFKRVNDQLGHMSGDFVLVQFAGFLKENMRQTDVIARYGGEEFIVLMPETDAETAKEIIERLSETWLLRPLVEPYHEKKLTVTFSAGIAQFGPDCKDENELIQASDKAMYAAKEAGRNRTFTIDQLDSLPELQSPLILVVDDSKLIRHVLEKQLIEKGYRVVTAGEGQKALEIALSQHPKVALVDMIMPGMGGLELIRNLKENPKTMSIKVIALTAANSEDTLLKAFQHGVDDYMNKPFTAPELEVRITRMLK
jgi:two-component system, cell cycle response regulator